MPGDHVELVADDGGRIAAFVDALARFPHEPAWALIGGFAVNVRIERVHRLTNDIDTVARDQAQLVELLVAEPDADRLDAAKLRFTAGDLPVDIDVMADTEGLPLPIEIGERIFALARRAVLPRAQLTELVVLDGRTTVARATVPVASIAGLVLLKTVAIPRRSAGNNPHKVGSDIHDLACLVDGQDLFALAAEICTMGDELSTWIGLTLVKWFSPTTTFATPTPASGACSAHPTPTDSPRPTWPWSRCSARWSLKNRMNDEDVSRSLVTGVP